MAKQILYVGALLRLKSKFRRMGRHRVVLLLLFDNFCFDCDDELAHFNRERNLQHNQKLREEK